MTNDSITVALMRKVGLTAVATYDADLDRIAGLRVYQPGAFPKGHEHVGTCDEKDLCVAGACPKPTVGLILSQPRLLSQESVPEVDTPPERR
jgi:hypothetical protein